jgi:hypothetical protein
MRASDSLNVRESTGSGREKLCAVRSADSPNVMLSVAVTTNDAGVAVSNPAMPCSVGWTSGPGPGRNSGMG